MFGKKETFRRAALERLSSPERLDEMMRAIPPKGWVAITTIIGLAALALLWGFFGSVPNRVEGQGLLIPGETKAVDAPTGGVVTRVFVKAGDMVKPGDRVAILTDPNAAEDLRKLELELQSLQADEVKAEQEDAVAQTQTENDFRAKDGKARADLARNQIALNQATVDLAEMVRAGPGVYGEQEKAKHRLTISTSSSQINTLKEEMELNRKQKEDADKARFSKRNDRRQKIQSKETEVYLKRLDQGNRLDAMHEGQVFDVMVDEGSTVTPKTTIARIEEAGQELQAVVYVPAREGQNVKHSHEVQIAPSNVKKEEYGTIRARVIDKQDYPSDKQAIISTIRNETLADEYTKNGAPLYVRIALDPLPDSENLLTQNPALSGYQWTSGKGPERKILSGTPCQATVITGYSRPIDKAISWLKTTTGL